MRFAADAKPHGLVGTSVEGILQGRRNGKKDGVSLREAREGEAGEDFLEGRSLSAAPPSKSRQLSCMRRF